MKRSWHWLWLLVAAALVAWVCYDYYTVAGQFGADARLWNSSVKASSANQIRWAYTQMLQARMRLTGGLVAAALCVGLAIWSYVRRGRAS